MEEPQILEGSPIDEHYYGTDSIIVEIARSFNENSDSTFAIFAETDTRFKYGEMLEMSMSIAMELKRRGISEGDLVSICSEQCPQVLLMKFGIWFSGAVFNPIPHVWGPEELRNALELVEPKLIFCSEKTLGKVREAMEAARLKPILVTPTEAPVLGSIPFGAWPNSDNSGYRFPTGDPKSRLMSVMFTSGTTGLPKGIMLSDACQKYNALSVSGWNGYRPKDKVMITSPIFWVSNPMMLSGFIRNPVTFIFPKSDATSQELLQVITKYKPTNWFTTHSVLHDLCMYPERQQDDLSSIRILYMGGSTASTDVKSMINKELFGERIAVRNLYGTTEAGLITYFPQELKSSDPEYASVGKVSNGVRLKVVHKETGATLGPNQEGEICVQTQTMLLGIVKKKLDDIKEIDAEGWFHTGDIGYYDSKHYLYFTSRLKDLLKFRGMQISPVELEGILRKHTDVIDCCVIGKQHLIDGDWPAAIVVKKPSSQITEQELCQFVAEQVPDFKKLRGGVFFVPTIPKSAVGKVLRNEAKKLIMA